jgi:hypothetical protein
MYDVETIIPDPACFKYCRKCAKIVKSAGVAAERHKAHIERRQALGGDVVSVGLVTLIYDPCETPLHEGMTLSMNEIDCMLRFGSLVEGTVLRRGSAMLRVAGQRLVEVNA